MMASYYNSITVLHSSYSFSVAMETITNEVLTVGYNIKTYVLRIFIELVKKSIISKRAIADIYWKYFTYSVPYYL
jgi:hypothetical protein